MRAPAAVGPQSATSCTCIICSRACAGGSRRQAVPLRRDEVAKPRREAGARAGNVALRVNVFHNGLETLGKLGGRLDAEAFKEVSWMLLEGVNWGVNWRLIGG